MRKPSILRFLPVLIFLFSWAPRAATNIIPGLTYYPGKEALSGRLNFLLTPNTAERVTKTETSAIIYQFDLTTRKLRKVSDSPDGYLRVSHAGDTFCVVHNFKGTYNSEDASFGAFIYSDKLRQGRTIRIEGSSKREVCESGHAFFELEGTNDVTVLDYDLERNQKHVIELPGASKWTRNSYKNIHAPQGSSNTLHLEYSNWSNIAPKVAKGIDYRDGIYSLDVATGRLNWFAEPADDSDDELYHPRAANGRYLEMEMPTNLFSGFKLTSNPLDYMGSATVEQKRQIKVLKKWAVLPILFSNGYRLQQISPDGLYALVSLMESSKPKRDGSSPQITTCFIVNTANGETRKLLTDGVAATTKGAIDWIIWTQ